MVTPAAGVPLEPVNSLQLQKDSIAVRTHHTRLTHSAQQHRGPFFIETSSLVINGVLCPGLIKKTQLVRPGVFLWSMDPATAVKTN